MLAARWRPLGHGQPVDRPGFEPGTFSLQGSCSNQLELAAQGGPAWPDGSPGQARERGCARESACLVLWCSAVDLSTRRHVHPAGWCYPRWATSISPVQMKTARRACALRAASGRCLHLYPEATPVTMAALGSKYESTPTCPSPRPHHVPDHGFTVRFLSSPLSRVRANARSGQRDFRPDSSVVRPRAARYGKSKGFGG
jgi:hypothetical protein